MCVCVHVCVRVCVRMCVCLCVPQMCVSHDQNYNILYSVCLYAVCVCVCVGYVLVQCYVNFLCQFRLLFPLVPGLCKYCNFRVSLIKYECSTV